MSDKEQRSARETLAGWEAGGDKAPTAAGHRVFFRSDGPSSAPWLVTLHGFPSSSIDFRLALPRLSRRHRVCLHDHLGFGLSDKPAEYSYSLVEQADAALDVWRHVGIERAHLLAHDYGTSVATELLARRDRGELPVEIRSVTLCNGSVHLDLARLQLAQRILRSPTLGPPFARLVNRAFFYRRIRRTLSAPDAVPAAELAVMWEALERADGRAAIPRISRYLEERVRFRHRWIEPLTRLDLPAHVLWGRRDSVAVPAIAEALAEEIPGAALTWLEELGHYPMLEDPAAWAEAAAAWIEAR